MGLKNAGIQFQQMMDDRLKKVSDTTNAYMDDILVGTVVEEGEDLLAAHDKDLRRTLQCLADDKLAADIGKCKFFVPKVKFCGHILNGGRRVPDPNKLSAIEKWEVPKTVSQLRAFLGFINYYSIYIPHYAQSAARLMEKLKVGREAGKKEARCQ